MKVEIFVNNSFMKEVLNLKYISIKEAAEKWNLTVRRVQDLCKKGDIHGATRLGRAWMIPESAQKPADGRTKHARVVNKAVKGKFLFPIPRENPFLIHTDLYAVPGTADEVVASFSEYPETERIVQAQFDCRRGNIDSVYKESKYILDTYNGFNSTISSGLILGICAMWRGDINLWHRARRHIYETPCKTEQERQAVSFWIGVYDSALFDTRDFPTWFREGKFDCMPFDSLCSVRVFYIKFLFIRAYELAKGNVSFEYVEGLGLMRTLPYIIEPMLSQAKAEKTLLPEIYLHLIAATIYHNLGENKKAESHIDEAIALSLPDKLYGVLVEYRSNLDSLLDERLMLADDGAYNTVKSLHKEMIKGWVKLHNNLLKRNVSSALTVREREVARLAAFGLSNMQIANQLHIEVSSVKRYIFSAMNKVGAEKRSELGFYI